MTAGESFVRKNAFLVAAVALPVLVIVFFLIATAIPRFTVAPPAYDLVLRIGKPYERPPQVSVEYKISDGQLQAIVRPVAKDNYGQAWALYRFDHQTQNLLEIPVRIPDSVPADRPPQTVVVEALLGRRILDQSKAPDGYELRTESSRSGGGLLGDIFGMRSYDQRVVLANGGRVLSLPLPSGTQYYSPINAVGWLVDSR